jgi:hypothetical protein
VTKHESVPEADLLRNLTVRLIGPAERACFDQLLEQKHSLHSARLGGQTLRYAAEVAGQCVALITFSGASPHTKTLRIVEVPRQDQCPAFPKLAQKSDPHSNIPTPHPKLLNTR